MNEIGFFHPVNGYWQTNSGVSDEILNSYPEGTIQVPVKPGYEYIWNGYEWVVDADRLKTKQKMEVPSKITMRQARLQLLSMGLLDDVISAIDQITDPIVKRAVQIEWEFATTVYRDSDWVITIMKNLNLTDDHIDGIFVAAIAL